MKNEMFSPVVIDVREADEFAGERIENSIHLPLSEFSNAAPPVLTLLSGKKVLLICQGGVRSELACGMVKQLGFGDSLSAESYSGGLQRWKEEGKPVVKGAQAQSVLPIMRQVQIIAGGLFLFSVAGAIFLSQTFLWLGGAVGVGLSFAGLTGYCGMAKVLAKMPWNGSAGACSVPKKSTLGVS